MYHVTLGPAGTTFTTACSAAFFFSTDLGAVNSGTVAAAVEVVAVAVAPSVVVAVLAVVDFGVLVVLVVPAVDVFLPGVVDVALLCTVGTAGPAVTAALPLLLAAAVGMASVSAPTEGATSLRPSNSCWAS